MQYTKVWFVLNLFMSLFLTVSFLYLNNRRVADSDNHPKTSQLNKQISPTIMKSALKVDNNGGDSNIKSWKLIKQFSFCLSAEAPEAGEVTLTKGSAVHLERCNPSDPLQYFRYNKKTGQIITKLRNKDGNTMCLDAYNVKGRFGSVQMYTCHKAKNKNPSQKWDIGKKTGKERYRIVSRTKLCLTTRNKDALAHGAWSSSFSNMPQQFRDYHKSAGNDYAAVRMCTWNYNFFYSRMQRWRFASPTITSDDDSTQKISSHDGVTVLLTVTDLEKAEPITQQISYTYPGIHIIIISGGEIPESDIADFHGNVIGLKEIMKDEKFLPSMIKTNYVLVMGGSNQLMPDFDFHSLIESLEGDPSILASAGFLQDERTLYRPCYTAIKIPIEEVEKFKLHLESQEVEAVNKTQKAAQDFLAFYKVGLAQLGAYRKKAKKQSGSTGLLSETKEKQTRFAKEKKPVDLNSGRTHEKFWVEGYFQVSKSATMACDRSSKPVMVRKGDIMHVLEQDLIDVRNKKNQDNIDTGPLEWKPKELVDGIEVDGKMRRISVNPGYRSRTSAYTCTQDPNTFSPLEDCFLPPDDMEEPLSLDQIWTTSSPCGKVEGVAEKRMKVRLFSQALSYFGRFIYEMPYYYMDGSLLGMIKLGSFAPWDSDLDVMLQLPKYFDKSPEGVEEFSRMIYITLRGMRLSIQEKEKKDKKIFKWINPTTFHTYIPVTSMWISSWFTVCKKNDDYTINEPWESCLKKLKNETLVFKNGYSRKSIQTDLHMTYPESYLGKETKQTGNLRIADKNAFYYVPYHYIETLYWWYDKERMLRNPWDCEWKYPLFYPPYKTKPYT